MLHREYYDIDMTNLAQESRIDYHNFVEKDEPIMIGSDNLDRYLTNIYIYFLGKGFWPIVLSKICNLLQFAFMVLFVTFLSSFIDYNELTTTTSLEDSIKFGADRIHPFIWMVLSMAIIFWVCCVIISVNDIRNMIHIRNFYHGTLQISDYDIQYIEWSDIVDKLIKVPRLCKVKENITQLDITHRIMRRDNYMIALFNRGILDIYVPGFPNIKLYTTFVQIIVRWIIFGNVFNNNMKIRSEITDPEIYPGCNVFNGLVSKLKYCFRFVGLILLIFSPFAFVLLILYNLFKYGDEVRNKPSFLSTRNWSRHAKWTFREFNELNHDFENRLNQSLEHARNYVKQFSNSYMIIKSQFISFILGSIVIVVVITGIIDSSVFQYTLLGRTFIWYVGIFGIILAICRSIIPDEDIIFEPEKHMDKVFKYTHYMPKTWRGKIRTKQVQEEFKVLFEYKLKTLLFELLSVLYTPLLLLFILPDRAEDILMFFKDFTRNVDGVGDVCAHATFDLDTFGNPEYGAVINDPVKHDKNMETNYGKMEKSFLAFKSKYKNWEPPIEGKKMLSNIANYYQHLQNSAVDSIQHVQNIEITENIPTLSVNYDIDNIVNNINYDLLQRMQESFSLRYSDKSFYDA